MTTARLLQLSLLAVLPAGAWAQAPAQSTLPEQLRQYTDQHPLVRGYFGQNQPTPSPFPGLYNTAPQNQYRVVLNGAGARSGRWWANPQTAELLGLTADQTRKMDDIFQQHRLRLIDLNASLEKEELILEPLMGADQPDDAKVMAQIDRVAQARAELEKANSRMLWSVRRVLTPDQWKKLQSGPVRK